MNWLDTRTLVSLLLLERVVFCLFVDANKNCCFVFGADD